MKAWTVDITEAIESLATYVRKADAGPVVITDEGRPVAALVVLENADLETVALSTNSEFLDFNPEIQGTPGSGRGLDGCRGPQMRTVILEVSSRKETNRRFLRALEGQQQGEFISFETPALLFKVLTQKRWELLSVMTGAGPMTLREVARRVGRDVKAVHGDVHGLLNAGILRKTEEGWIVFPFDAVHVNFMLTAA